MFKIAAVCAIGCLAIATAIPVFEASVDAALYASEFAAFKANFDKVYQSAEHEAERFGVFVNNFNFIRNHKGDGYTVGVNQFADLTHEEFKSFYLGYKPSGRAKTFFATEQNVTVPDDIDWTTKGAVTPIKNQAQCGSCWAFSATGALEGAIFTQQGVLESLSEQELVSCDKVDSGCNGGAMDNAFTFAEKNGLALESQYPYTSGTGNTGTCSTAKESPAAPHSKVTKFTDVTPNSETALKAAVAQQPVAVAIEADKQAFQFYTSGIIKATAGCGTNLDHGVLAVGYGTDAGTLYWKVKNSWGATWGDKGFVRLERKESASSKGTCGIAMDASWPTVS
jgi:cathepsin L